MDEQGTPNNHKTSRRKGQGGAAILNIFSILIAVSILSVLGVSLLIFINPYIALNPFPPSKPLNLTLLTRTPTAMPTPSPIPTETFTPAPTSTVTPRPSSTLPPSPTPFTLFTPSATAEPTEPPEGYPFRMQEGSPIAIANISRPELGCNWMGVAGQVFDLSGAPVTGLLIRLGGSLAGESLPREMLSLTGAALNYGRVGYYEFTLADRPIPSKQTVWVQLVNQEYTPLSEKIYFDTFENCEKNLIIINFKQVR